MSDERSERLRNRRKRSAEKVKEGKEDKEDKEDKPVKTDKTEETEEEDKPTPVKDRDDWSAKQMHLPDELKRRLELDLDEMNLELKKDEEDGLEKLMHWYPLVVEAGLDEIETMDVDEIKTRAEQYE